MKTKENEVKVTFTMVDDKLLSTSISRITAQQKLLISWVLRFQKNKLECFASNNTIANTFGMSKDGVKSLLKSCSHSFPTFFTCTPDTRDNGVPYHTISIDLEKLMDFIVDGTPVSKIQRRNKPSTEKEAAERTISTQVIEDIKVEEIVAKIEDNAVIEDLFSSTYDGHINLITLFKNFNNKEEVKLISEDIIDMFTVGDARPSLFNKEDITEFLIKNKSNKNYSKEIKKYLYDNIKIEKQLA